MPKPRLKPTAGRLSTTPLTLFPQFAELSPYVAAVLAVYLSLPDVRRRRPTWRDIRFAVDLERARLPLFCVLTGLLRVQVERYRRGRENPALASIGALRYFLEPIRQAYRDRYADPEHNAAVVAGLFAELADLAPGYADPGIEFPK